MSKSNFTKPVRTKQYVGKKTPVVAEPTFTAAEDELAARAAANPSSEDLSVKEDVDLSDAEVVARYRRSLSNTVLPVTPNLPGFHACWVPISTNNHTDTVDFRKQLGYILVRQEEIPNYVIPSNRSALVEGCVTHNELVLMKLPLRLYELYMKESHHIQPNEQERSIKEVIQERFVDPEGKSITRDTAEMTGINRLARKVAEPTFT